MCLNENREIKFFISLTDRNFTMKDMKVMKKGFDDLSYAAIGAAIEVLKHGIKNFVLKKNLHVLHALHGGSYNA